MTEAEGAAAGARDPSGDGAPPSDRLADRIEASPSVDTSGPWLRVLRELADVDKAVFRAVAATPTPVIDGPLRAFTSAADHSKLWFATAAVMFVAGGRNGRRAALTGVAALACTSAVVNLLMKLAGRRPRPDADAAGVPPARRVEMPTSRSFPSGHAASAAAFASSVSQVVPALGLPLGVAAATVGYSRVHAGVHYPGDVVAGSVVGGSIGGLVAWVGRRIATRRERTAGHA